MANSSFSLTLPSSEATLTFRTPLVQDRCRVLKNYERETGFTPEDVIALLCVERINGEKVDGSADPLATFGIMELNDYNYYFDVFSTMFFSDLERRNSAKEVAKKLLSGESITTPKKVESVVTVSEPSVSAV